MVSKTVIGVVSCLTGHRLSWLSLVAPSLVCLKNGLALPIWPS
jgi:hypothetical protein